METNKGKSRIFIFIEVTMLGKQTKNNIKAVLAVAISVIVGEGIFGFGFFWPFLFILLEWRAVYWLSLLVGVLISALYRIPVGLPSLFLVVVVGGLSFVFSSRKETGWVMLLISIIANFVFDKTFGLWWNWWEVVFVFIAWLVAVRWFEQETIKLNY